MKCLSGKKYEASVSQWHNANNETHAYICHGKLNQLMDNVLPRYCHLCLNCTERHETRMDNEQNSNPASGCISLLKSLTAGKKLASSMECTWKCVKEVAHWWDPPGTLTRLGSPVIVMNFSFFLSFLLNFQILLLFGNQEFLTLYDIYYFVLNQN